jgi:membrane associated rhomboid family serine protease
MGRRSGSMSLGFPPFTYAVKWLVIINSGIYLLMLLIHGLKPGLANSVLHVLALIPHAVIFQGRVWQIVTYSFFHGGLFHLLFNMLTLWMFGSQFEIDWGRRHFLEYYFWCVVGAAFTSIAVGYGALAIQQAYPAPLFENISSLIGTATIGASGGIFGILIAYGILYGNREILLWFFLPIKAKYLIAGFIFIALVGALGDSGGVANFAHLGGAFFGWLYLKFIPRKGLQFATSERYYGIRNWWIKQRRRRAAKKFEVYMRDKNQPTNYQDYFDEYGNYKDPNAPPRDKGDGESRGPWVN